MAGIYSRSGGWMALTVGLLFLATDPVFLQSAVASLRTQNNTSDQLLSPQVAQVTPPPPAPVPPNSSRVTATVLEAAVWPAGSGPVLRSVDEPPQMQYSLTLTIDSAEPVNPGLKSYVHPGTVLEVFSTERLGSDLVGKTVTATLELTGDTQSIHWRMQTLETLSTQGLPHEK